jgi:Tol biopolymer transport system component
MVAERPRSNTREAVAWIIALASVAALAGLVMFRDKPAPASGQDDRVYRSTIPFPEQVTLLGEDPARFALSPDGRKLAFVAAGADGKSMLWVRPLDGLIAQPLAGTEGATYPFWSPDSRFIGFIHRPEDVIVGMRGYLKKVAAEGGQPITLTALDFAAMSAWSGDVILFTAAGNSPLHRISARGGDAVPATSLDTKAGEVQHSYPAFLPDARHFLYSAVGSAKGGATDARAVYVGTVDSKEAPRRILERSSNARYANGHLLFLRDGTLLAQPFDTDRLEVRGEPLPLAERVLSTGAGGGGGLSAAFSVSDNGVLAYQSAPLNRSQLAWVDRSGKRLANLGDQADYVDVVLSPTAERAAVSVMHPELGTRDIWIFDVARGLRERFTTGPSDDFAPVWSPDGGRIVYSSLKQGGVDLFEKGADGSERRLDTGPAGIGKFAADWSRDGKKILYIGGGRIIARSDLMLLPLEGERRPRAFLDASFVETQGRFSPDGRWIAYAANESGRLEVYVRPYPGPGAPERVSSDGGQWPRWRRDGTELFYIAPDDTLTAAAVNGQGTAFQVKAVRPLFKTRPRSRVRLDAYFYDVAPDGQRFLLNTLVEGQASTPPITLVVNWPSLLKQ